LSGAVTRPGAPGASAAEKRHRLLHGLGRRLLAWVAVLLPLTALFWMSDLDLAMCRVFYGSAEHPWPHVLQAPWVQLYLYGSIPSLALGIGGFLVALASIGWRRLRPWRTSGVFLAVVLALGPGLVVNGWLKPWLSRPRPYQITDFGGEGQYVQAWRRGPPGGGDSFPSGHASMGFYLLAPAFLPGGAGSRWRWSFLALGLGGGSLMGLGRIVQGGHFPSDIVWAGGLVWLTAITLRFMFDWLRAPLAVTAEDGPPPAAPGAATTRDA
jgi:lipid A 4'-phosphatase